MNQRTEITRNAQAELTSRFTTLGISRRFSTIDLISSTQNKASSCGFPFTMPKSGHEKWPVMLRYTYVRKTESVC